MTSTAPDTTEATAPEKPRPSWRKHVTGPPGRLLLAVLAGVILQLSFPPRTLWWLAPLAFAGLGLALYGRRARAGFGYGLAFGVSFYLLHLMWIQDFLGSDFGSAPWLALSGLQALFAAVACAGMAAVARLPAAPVWMAALWIGQEAARTAIPLNGFPWGRTAFSQPSGAYTSLASVGGAPLVGFAVVLSGLGLAQLIARTRGRGWTTAAACAAVPLAAGLAVWPTVGTDATTGTVTAAVVQGNAPDVGLDLLSKREEIRANHLAASARLQQRIDDGEVERPDLVVWPETATAVQRQDAEVDRLVQRFGVPALIGALYIRDDGLTENAVFAWDPDSGRGAHYAKRELVPFAEYVPWRAIARWFTPFLDNTSDMLWGQRPGVLDVNGLRVGVAICYEAAYDYVARETVDRGAELLVVPTNNAWYGPGEMTYQQLAMSRLRAVEHGRSVVVAATSGVSALVRPDGSMLDSSELFVPDTLVERLPLRDTTTLATVLGPWPERLIVGGGVLALLASIGLRFRARGAWRGRRTAA